MTALRGRRGRLIVVGVAAVALLFAGRWVTMFLADRWWAEAVAPEAVGFLTRWHLLEVGLEIGGLAVAGAWCVGHLLIVIGSIGTVQVPRRLGDLEIRELVTPETLRTAAILVGGVLGVVLGSGAGRAAPLVAQAWHGARHGIVDPILGLDLGVYLVQLPFWSAALSFAQLLTWTALLGGALCHFVLGGVRVTRAGLAMTESARLQLGFLVAGVLALATVGEALAPLRSVSGLEGATLAGLSPGARWSVALAWGIAALAVGLWAVRPWPPLIIGGLGLWAGTGLLTQLVAPTMPPHALVAPSVARPIAALATGLDHLLEETAPDESGVGKPPGAGLWSVEALRLLLESNGAELRSLAPSLIVHGGVELPVWLAVRTSSEGPEVVVIADDRLAAGGAPVSFREDDPADYPGIVSWRRLGPLLVGPGMQDTVAVSGPGGMPLGGAGRRLILAWGTQAAGALGGAPSGAALWWRMAPRDRVAHLFPPAWWDEPRPIVLGGRVAWLLDGWLTMEGAPLAPAIPWEGSARRYARPAFQALIDAANGSTRFFLRPDADALARGWAERAPGFFAPADSAPPELRLSLHSERSVAVQAWALQHGPYEMGTSGTNSSADSVLMRPALAWTGRGPAPELPVGEVDGEGRFRGRIRGLLIGRPGSGPVLVRWPEGAAPTRPSALISLWQRFASFERLHDSVGAAGGRIIGSPVRYDVGPEGTLATQVLYLVPVRGTPVIGWVNLARIDRLGAARTPGSAWANLKGESAPLVPSPDLPDAIVEARSWAARADSALRAGDLEGFGRAFEALKRVLGTP